MTPPIPLALSFSLLALQQHFDSQVRAFPPPEMTPTALVVDMNILGLEIPLGGHSNEPWLLLKKPSIALPLHRDRRQHALLFTFSPMATDVYASMTFMEVRLPS